MQNNNNQNLQNQLNYNIHGSVLNNNSLNVQNNNLKENATNGYLNLKNETKDLFREINRRNENVWKDLKNQYAQGGILVTQIKSAIVEMFRERTQDLLENIKNFFSYFSLDIRKLIREEKYAQAIGVIGIKQNEYERYLNEFNSIVASYNNEPGKLETNMRLIIANRPEIELMYNQQDLQPYMNINAIPMPGDLPEEQLDSLNTTLDNASLNGSSESSDEDNNAGGGVVYFE